MPLTPHLRLDEALEDDIRDQIVAALEALVDWLDI
jgi:hypothetical protein